MRAKGDVIVVAGGVGEVFNNAGSGAGVIFRR